MMEKMAENLLVDPISVKGPKCIIFFCDMELIDVCPVGMYV